MITIADKLDNCNICLVEDIVKKKLTIRELAKKYMCSKSSMHDYLHSERFKNHFVLHKGLYTYNDVLNVLKFNFDNKHISGGQATKMKYERMKLRSYYDM